MKRNVPGLSDTARDSHTEVPDGVFLVRLDGAQHRWQSQKRFYLLRLSVLEPKSFAGRSIVSRLYCTPKAMWKLGWFLRDFLYDPELLSQDEIDERALRGLVGVVKISPYGDQWHLAGELRWLRSSQPVGGTVHCHPRPASWQR